MDVTDLELCEYLQVRHAKLESPEDSGTSSPTQGKSGQQQQQPQQRPSRATLPSKFYKHWTSLWVVLHVEVSPNYSYIGYCKKEADWLADSQTIAKCMLDESFKVDRPPAGYSKKFDNVLQLTFKGYRLDLSFESMTKLDQWFKALLITSDRHHVDLVRCHEHPQLEGEYVVQVCSSSYVVWNPNKKPCLRPQWEWQLKHIRRVHWHKNVNKLEVEPGRSSDTGEGHFYFTGRHAYRLFQGMKHMMSSHSQVSSPFPSRPEPQHNGLVRTREREGGSGSESDWTGTGDDWTGASSDSAFINFIRSHHQQHHGSSPRMSPNPTPLVPPISTGSSGEAIYTGLLQQTLNHDNQYCSIDRLHPVASAHSPTPNRMAPPTATAGTTPLDSVAELGESLTEEDEYCKMVPNASIRSELLKKTETPLSPLLSRRPLPPAPIAAKSSPSLSSIPSPIPPQRHASTIKSSPSEPALRRHDLNSPNVTPQHRHPVPIGGRGQSMDIRYNM